MSPNQEIVIPAKSDLGALGNRINLATRQCHNKIDKLMTLKFALAVRDPKVYRQGVQLFYHLFRTIEDCLEIEMNRDTKYSTMLRAIWKPALARTSNIHSDLMFFYGDSMKFDTPILKQQIQFVEIIRRNTAEKPYLLLAYMHVLYLALFAGGRIMFSQVAKSLRLFPQVEGRTRDEVVALGTNLFRFEVDDPMQLRAEYKRDYELETRNFLTEKEKEEILEESKTAFMMVMDGISEIEYHNMGRLSSKIGYQVVSNIRLIMIPVLMLVVMVMLLRLSPI